MIKAHFEQARNAGVQLGSDTGIPNTCDHSAIFSVSSSQNERNVRSK